MLRLGILTLTVACGSAVPQPPVQVQPEDGILVLVENRTPDTLGVYFAEEQGHTRLGTVPPNTETALLVRNYLMAAGPVFRVYAFRGAEACPVARQLDSRLSRTPRVTVTRADTVVSGYLPADACRKTMSPRGWNDRSIPPGGTAIYHSGFVRIGRAILISCASSPICSH